MALKDNNTNNSSGNGGNNGITTQYNKTQISFSDLKCMRLLK